MNLKICARATGRMEVARGSSLPDQAAIIPESRACRDAILGVEKHPDNPPANVAVGRHFTVQELALLWAVSEMTIRRTFEHEVGVIKFGHTETRYKRKRFTLRIPMSVAIRVHQRLHG